MRMTLLASAAVIAFASAPAFAQDTECPQGTSKTSLDGSPVTCSADTTDDTTTGSVQTPDSPLDNTDAGQGVKDAVTDGANNNK